jgi:hypothetical protein
MLNAQDNGKKPKNQKLPNKLVQSRSSVVGSLPSTYETLRLILSNVKISLQTKEFHLYGDEQN